MMVWVIYDIETDLPVCVAETAQQASDFLGVDRSSVFRAVQNNWVTCNRYTIVKVDINEEEDDDEAF